jgi:sn-glycerol 3-phosphate transport system ATP-binding protein
MSEIAFRQVRKTYGKNAVVHGVDLTVKTGELLVILGPSGCGKSTLLRMVAGLEAITAGEITFDGMVVNHLEPRERGCAMVFQNYALYPHMTVADNIGYALRVAGISRGERSRRVTSVAETLGLSELLSRKPGQLSGGQRQRVAMGRAMIRQPKVFLYDEPLSNLDAKLRVAMRMEIRKLHQKLGSTTLFVTHDQVEAMTLADRIVVMNRGVIEQVGTPAEVYSNPHSTFVASFVGAPGMNLMSGHLDDDRKHLALPCGHRIALDGVSWTQPPPREVIVGVRAEDIAISQGHSGLAAEVQFIEQLGPAGLVHTLAGMSELVVTCKANGYFKAGQVVSLQIAPATLHFFDIQSGRRLGADCQGTSGFTSEL